MPNIRRRATFSGTLGGVEIFAFGFGYVNDTAVSLESDVTALQTWVSDFMGSTGVAATLAASVAFNRVRANSYTTTGSTEEAAEGSLTQVGTGTVSLPYEVACVVSLRSANASRSGRGRFYLPPFATGMLTGSTGAWSTGSMTNIVAGLTTAFNNFATPARHLVIHHLVTQAQSNLVTRFDVGNVPDAQRRRRNRQVEVRSGAPIVL